MTHFARLGVALGCGVGLALAVAADATAGPGGAPPPAPGKSAGNTRTNGDFNAITGQWANGVITQESTGVNKANGLGNLLQIQQGVVIWEDGPPVPEIPAPTPPPPAPPSPPATSDAAQAAAAAAQAAFDAMNQITPADLNNVNVDVNNFTGEGADVEGNGYVADDAAEMQAIAQLNQAALQAPPDQIDTDLAGDEDVSGSATFAPIYAGYNLNAPGGLAMTSLDLFPPMPSDVMTSLDLQPALCGR